MELENVCEQFKRKSSNAEKALSEIGLCLSDVKNLRVSDYKLEYVDRNDIELKNRVNTFICENEYLQKPHKRTTHTFVAKYKNTLAGVVTFSTPNSFSNILGYENRHLEKLISRGATSAIGCKNLGSALNAFALKWMVTNTEFRFFTAYSDPEANELGTIYKALNFIFLGSKFGTNILLFDPKRPNKGWFSDREVRKLYSYKRFAFRLGYAWENNWNSKWKINWNHIPTEISKNLRDECKRYISSCVRRRPAKKLKWLYIKGRTTAETKYLQDAFKAKNPKMVQENGMLGFPYPAESMRGHHD